MEKKLFNVQTLLDKHEVFKLKWLQDLTLEDLFEWVKLKEDMTAQLTEMSSYYMENKLELDKKKWERMIFLKWELDENGKKRYTDTTAQAIINDEFYKEDIDQLTLKASVDLLKGKVQNIIEYVNLVKYYMKLDDDYMQNMK
jgi:hypothetical protein